MNCKKDTIVGRFDVCHWKTETQMVHKKNIIM